MIRKALYTNGLTKIRYYRSNEFEEHSHSERINKIPYGIQQKLFLLTIGSCNEVFRHLITEIPLNWILM